MGYIDCFVCLIGRLDGCYFGNGVWKIIGYIIFDCESVVEVDFGVGFSYCFYFSLLGSL